MQRIVFICVFWLACPAQADTILAARTMRAQTILTAQDLVVKQNDTEGGVTVADLIGKETRVALYGGRPVRRSDVGPPALVERNQIVPLIFEQNGLRIVAEGRSLARAGPGEYVRVMNLASRTTITGLVLPDGRIRVSQ